MEHKKKFYRSFSGTETLRKNQITKDIIFGPQNNV